MKITAIYTTLLTACVVNSVIVFPDDITSIAEILYSKIPPIKIGQDSRVGVGFRVGPSADAQVLLELGPQSSTAALAGQADPSKLQVRRQRPRHTAAEREQILHGLLGRMRSSLAAAEDRKEKS